MVTTIDELYADLPKVHRGGTHTFHIAREVAAHLESMVGPGSRTLETGCGFSTALFAMRGATHTCITRFAEEAERVTEYLASHGIDSSNITFHVGRSQDVLPRLVTDSVDVVLIDGQHAFPVPFLDWYYANRLLRVGGTLVIDDTQIWTGHVLRGFLADEPAWRLTNDFFGRAATFTKLAHAESEGWAGQPFVARRSRAPRFAEKVRRRMAVATGAIRNEHNAKAPMSSQARAMRDGTP